VHIRKLDNNKVGENINPKSNTPHKIVVRRMYVKKITLSVPLGNIYQSLIFNFKWRKEQRVSNLREKIHQSYSFSIVEIFFKK
jgi:hypothetical protein